MEKAKETYYKQKKAREQEHVADLSDKVTFNLKELPNPQPVTYNTFDKYAKTYNQRNKNKSNKKSKFKSFGFWCRGEDTTR